MIQFIKLKHDYILYTLHYCIKTIASNFHQLIFIFAIKFYQMQNEMAKEIQLINIFYQYRIISLFFTGVIKLNTAQKICGRRGKLLVKRINLNNQSVPNSMTLIF